MSDRKDVNKDDDGQSRLSAVLGGTMTNAELQIAIDSLLKHAVIVKRKWWGGTGNNEADGAFSDCLARMLYEQARRAGCWPRHP